MAIQKEFHLAWRDNKDRIFNRSIYFNNVCGGDIIALRTKQIELLRDNIKRKKSTLILGRSGSGKTWTLSYLKGVYVEYPGMKLILEAIIKERNLPTERAPRYMSVAELLMIVRPKLTTTVVLLDEFQDARRPVLRLIEKLIKEGITIIAAAERKPWTGIFREIIYLEPLTRIESENLVCRTIKETDPLAVEIIATKSLGYPGKIIELSKAYSIAIKNGDVNPHNNITIVKFFNTLRPEMPERVNILPVEYLFVIGFGALTFKLFFLDKGDMRTGYMIGAIGYLTLMTWRTLWMRKRKY